MVDYILDTDRIQSFAEYADKHELFDLFEGLMSRMLIEKPPDPLQWAIDYLQQPKVPSIIIIGPPSSGTAKLCENVARIFDAVYISTGELLQLAIEKQTSMGMQAKPFMERGHLVPDQIMLSLVMQRLLENDVAQKGYVLEGFPLTKEQALAMQIKGMFPTHFIHLEVPDEVIVDRTVGTRIDPVTKKAYHLVYDPPPRSVAIEARLIQKNSHTEPQVRARLAQYRRYVRGVLSCFQKTMRRMAFPRGIVGNEEAVLAEVVSYVGSKKRTHAPRQFKIIIAGLPGSGKSTLANLIQKEYGFIHVPDNVMVEMISRRLGKPDCLEHGWVLEGFPYSKNQAEDLKKNGVVPNRLIWLKSDMEECRQRLIYRRYEPDTGRVVNLKALPRDVPFQVASTWPRRPEDDETIVAKKFDKFRNAFQDLESFYGFKQKGRITTTTLAMTLPPKESDGIIQEIKSEGLGEGDGFGKNELIWRAFELIEKSLLHPIPLTTSIPPPVENAAQS
ncbi:Adenylate kinase 8 [Phlyctochytrium bullatum]|nr:Adenylate kinase 8 [Phlyctochytrium bullatum]